MKNKKGQADFLGIITSVLTSVWFYVVLIAMALTGVGMRWMKKVNLNRKKLIAISIVGLVFATGLVSLAMLGVGSVGDGAVSSVRISQIQTTTPYVLNGSSDAGVDDTRMSDFYDNEEGTDPEIENGVWLVTRSNGLEAQSCTVKIIKPGRFDVSDTTYHIVEENADTGVMQAYVYTGTSSVTATSTHPKETNQLAFAEGVATGYVSVNITIDSTGFNALSQYDYKDIKVDICGYPYTFRLHKNDA